MGGHLPASPVEHLEDRDAVRAARGAWRAGVGGGRCRTPPVQGGAANGDGEGGSAGGFYGGGCSVHDQAVPAGFARRPQQGYLATVLSFRLAPMARGWRGRQSLARGVPTHRDGPAVRLAFGGNGEQEGLGRPMGHLVPEPLHSDSGLRRHVETLLADDAVRTTLGGWCSSSKSFINRARVGYEARQGRSSCMSVDAAAAVVARTRPAEAWS